MILWTSDSLYCMESSGQNKGLWMFFLSLMTGATLKCKQFSCAKGKKLRSSDRPNVAPPFTENETLEGAIKERCLRGLIPPELPSPQERPALPFEVEGHCSAISFFKSTGSIAAAAAAERKQLSVWGSGTQQNSRRGQQPLGA